jgi:hypothetical protein
MGKDPKIMKKIPSKVKWLGKKLWDLQEIP